MNIRLVKAPIRIVFSKIEDDIQVYEREYHKLSVSDEDPIGQWLKVAKGRGETADTDPVLLNLIIELHRKVDHLEQLIKNEVPQRISLHEEAMIESIGFGYFRLERAGLEAGALYYGRIEMPVHPKRDIGVFFTALDPHLAKIEKMHEQDEKDWGAYLTARERILIREQRARHE